MSRRIYKNESVMILSAERKGLSERSNAMRTRVLEQVLRIRGHAAKRVLGCFEGVLEDSFVCHADNGLLDVAEIFEQDSVLYVKGETRVASLMQLRPRANLFTIGVWESVARETALMNGAYTYDKEYDCYYMVDISLDARAKLKNDRLFGDPYSYEK